jgi:PiT family inorganic phosphate transporter
MTPSLSVVLAAGFLIAYVNGANDVSKGIATLVGSGVTDYRRAIRWGALWTAAGGLAGGSLAWAMVATFGNGLLSPGTTPTSTAAVATILGASAWVLVATRSGMPVSTTHAIVGAIAGVGVVAYGLPGVSWTAIGGKIILPLLLSPLASLALTALLFRAAPGVGRTAAADCVCADLEPVVTTASVVPALGASALVACGVRPTLSVATQAACTSERPAALRLTLDHAHWLTSGATSFTRGMNDAPKMVALMLAASALAGPGVDPHAIFGLVTLGMVAGSLVGGRRVTHVLAERITRLDHREGVLANVVTAALVAAGAVGGLPMSTTHVSSTAIIGAGTRRAGIHRRTVRDLVLAWVVTVPAAATLGILMLGIATLVGPGSAPGLAGRAAVEAMSRSEPLRSFSPTLQHFTSRKDPVRSCPESRNLLPC